MCAVVRHAPPFTIVLVACACSLSPFGITEGVADTTSVTGSGAGSESTASGSTLTSSGATETSGSSSTAPTSSGTTSAPGTSTTVGETTTAANSSTSTSAVSTGPGCSDGEEACPCLGLDTCLDGLVCTNGTCVAPDQTTGSTTEGPPAQCGDGQPVPGELCFKPATPLGMGSGPIAVVVADFNKDGYDDIASVNNTSQNVTMRTGKGDGTFGALVALGVGQGPGSAVTPDFNNDGAPDLVIRNTGDLSVFRNNGVGMMIAQMPIAVAPKQVGVVSANLDGDEYDDLVVAVETSLVVFLGDGNGFSSAGSVDVIDQPSCVAVADMTGDGALDLVSAHGDATVRVSLGNGMGNFGPPTASPAGGEAFAVALADLNGDGDTDALVADPELGECRALPGNGLGGFGAAIPYACGVDPWALILLDITADGAPDAVVTNASANTVSVLRGDGAGGFAMPESFVVGFFPSAVAAGDFNDDGAIDLITANFADSTVTVLLSDP